MQGTNITPYPNRSRPTRGSPGGDPTRGGRASDGDEFELRDRAGRQTDRRRRRCGCSPTTGRFPARRSRCQRARTSTVHVDEPRRPRGHRALARAAPRQPVRRHARDPGADPRRRDASRYRDHVPRPRRLLVPPAHPRGLRPGDGPVRQHPRRARRARLLAAGATESCCSRWTTSCIEDGKVAPFSRTETTYVAMGRFGNVHARHRRAGPLAGRASAARSSAST